MPVTDIREIRLLPPLGIGRFGGSAEPMHNYESSVTAGAGFRSLAPSETLVVDENSGAIVARHVPATMRFKDGAGLVKPVCPFFEVWALFDAEEEYRPLTLAELTDLRLDATAVSWDATFANLKLLRRTGVPADRITAEQLGIADHARRRLDGRAVNFRANRSIHLGWVQYIRPTAEFPQIRFRFTPPAGDVYGASQDNIVPQDRAVYDPTRGTWDNHTDDAPPTMSPDPRAHVTTVPGGIYARDSLDRNLGYIDDSSDGIITVTLTLRDGRKLSSFARASAGPPDFAPDSLPVRSMGDELEQIAFGPFAETVGAEEILDIVRRALDHIRLTDTAHENRRYARNAFSDSEAAPATTRAIHTGILLTLEAGLSAPANSAERRTAHATLTRIDQVLRSYDQIGDRSATGRRRMPALMRGADGLDLALTRRQRNKIARALEVFAPAPSEGPPQVVAMERMIRAFQAVAGLHAEFSEGGKNLAERFPNPAEVFDYLRSANAKGAVAEAAGVKGEPLVAPGDPAHSAWLVAIRRPDHPMNGPLSGYRDPETGKSGLETIEDWITSLGAGV